MAMFGGKQLPAPSAQDLADYQEILRRSQGMPDGAVFNDNPSYGQPTAAPAPAPPVQQPQGMFGNPGTPAPVAPSQPDVANAPALSPQMPTAPLDTGVGAIKPHFFDKTGTGTRIANGLGAFSTNLLALHGNQGAQAMLADQAKSGQEADLLKRQALSQQNILSRQMAFEQYKLQNPADPALIRTADALFPRGSAQWTQFVKAASLTPHLIGVPNISGGTDYQDLTGMYQAPGGGGLPSAPITKVVNGKTYYGMNGGWYDNPEGK